jgi:hypothetical protein
MPRLGVLSLDFNSYISSNWPLKIPLHDMVIFTNRTHPFVATPPGFTRRGGVWQVVRGDQLERVGALWIRVLTQMSDACDDECDTILMNRTRHHPVPVSMYFIVR